MSTGAFLIARLGSKRLPGKNIMKIAGKPMMQLLAERVTASHLVDKVVIATSTERSDDPLEALAHRIGVGCYRGPLENVMERICGAAKAHDCDNIVELLGDNPLVHSGLIDDVIRFYRGGGYDYAATVTKEYPVSLREKRFFSVGVRVQVYTRDAAEKWMDYVNYMKGSGKHPSAYIFEHPDRFKVGYFEARERWAFMNKPNLTFAVNYEKNLNLVRRIFEICYVQDTNFSLEMVYALLEKEPKLHSLMGNE